MKHIHRIMVILLVCLLLATIGCSKPTNLPSETVAPMETVPIAEVAEPNPATDPLHVLRQSMKGTSQLFAVAYLGYHTTIDWDTPVDPYAAIQEYTPGLCQEQPFLLQMPMDQIIGDACDLFCIVPLDPDATVAVSRGYWDDENLQCIYDDTIYYSDNGDPIFLFCNNDMGFPEMQVYISGPSGDVCWCPTLDDNGWVESLRNDNWDDLLLDFTPYQELLMADHREMINCEWILPTENDLIGTRWDWVRYLADGSRSSCEMSIENDFIAVRWNDGIDEEDHIYEDAPWELTYKEDFAILTIDFGNMAGILRFNLLFDPYFDQLYVTPDATQEEIPVTWEPLRRYMAKASIPDPIEMVGTWELSWTEIEGDINGATPGTQFIEISSDYAGLYTFTYTNKDRPNLNIQNRELVVFPFEIYPDCGNDKWYAKVNYGGPDGLEYVVTVLEDGNLLMQTYWEIDGAPMVSYGWYRSVE